jgi:hypothetical protein
MTETAKGKNSKTFGFAVDIVEPSVFSAALTTSSVRNPQGATELRAACDLLLPMLPNPRFNCSALATSSVRNPQGATELRAACDLLLPILPNPRFKINLGFPLSVFRFHLPNA